MFAVVRVGWCTTGVLSGYPRSIKWLPILAFTGQRRTFSSASRIFCGPRFALAASRHWGKLPYERDHIYERGLRPRSCNRSLSAGKYHRRIDQDHLAQSAEKKVPGTWREPRYPGRRANSVARSKHARLIDSLPQTSSREPARRTRRSVLE